MDSKELPRSNQRGIEIIIPSSQTKGNGIVPGGWVPSFSSYKKGHLVYWAGLFSLLGIVCVIHAFFINRFFPLQEGWFQAYSQLMDSGKVMYRDFYMYLPPLFPMQMHLLNHLVEGSFLAFRIYGLVERLLLIALAYATLCRFFKPAHVWFALLVSANIYYSNLQDVIYGYYQTSLLVSMFSIYLFLLFYDAWSLQKNAKAFVFLSATGLAIGVGVLYKQSSGVMIAVAFILVLTTLLFKNKTPRKLSYFAVFFGSAALPVAACVGWLVGNGVMEAFVSQVLGGASSKGSLLSILFGFWPRIFTPRQAAIFLSFFALLYYCRILLPKAPTLMRPREMTVNGLYLWSGLFFLSTLFVYMFQQEYWGYFRPLLSYLRNTLPVCLFVCGTGLVLFLAVIFFHQKPILMILSVAVLSLACVLAVGFSAPETRSQLRTAFNIFEMIEMKNSLVYYSFYFVFLLALCNFIGIVIKKPFLPDTAWIVVMGVGVWMYSHGLSATIEPHAALYSLAICICCALRLKIPLIRIKETAVYALGILFVCAILIQRMTLPYHWWGWIEDPIERESVSISEPGLEGFAVTERTADTIERICALVEKNSEPGGNLYTFPHIPIFNVLTGRISESTFSTVHYFDVCSDEIASADAERLRESPPEVIVWLALSNDDWKTHEELFRDGARSGQRDIKELVEGWVRDGEYTVLDQIENIYVLKRAGV